MSEEEILKYQLNMANNLIKALEERIKRRDLIVQELKKVRNK